MKLFPSNFAAEKNKRTGASPIWILKCPFAAGTIYLSDAPLIIPNWNGETITTKPWIKQWGQVDESISDRGIEGIGISDFNMLVINDPDDSNNILSILENPLNAPETTDCELYLWFLGLNAATDPPQLMWVGNIIDWQENDELLIELQLIDQAIRFNKYIGTKVTKTAYPYANPDDYDKIIPIVFSGKYPSVCVNAGAVSELRYSSYYGSEIASTDGAGHFFYVKDGSRFPLSGNLKICIDEEVMSISHQETGKFVIVERGLDNTIAANHWYNSPLWEQVDKCYYLLADSGATVNAIYARVGDWELIINSVVTLYGCSDGSYDSGAPNIGFKQVNGLFHSSYPFNALVSVPTRITKIEAETILNDNNVSYKSTDIDTILGIDNKTTIRQLVELAENITIGDGTHSHEINVTSSGVSTGSSTYKGTSATGGTSPSNAIDGSQATWAVIPPLISLIVTFPSVSGATSTLCWIKGSAGLEIKTGGITQATISIPQHDTWVSFNVTAGAGEVQIYNPGDVNKNCYEVELEHTGAAMQSSGITAQSASSASTQATDFQSQNTFVFSGNSVANAYIGDAVIALAYDGSNSLAGFINKYAGMALENILTIDSSGNEHSGIWYGDYTPSGVILEYKKLMEWLKLIAFQCRYYFRFYKGKAYFIYKMSSKTAQKEIGRQMTRMNDDFKTSLKTSMTGLEQVINKITLHYNRDFSLGQDDDGAYSGHINVQDVTSISKYGEKEQPDLFYFDFIADETKAQELADFYLSMFKDRKKLYRLDVFLDNSEIEFADWILLKNKNYKCEVQETDINPGSGMDMRNDTISLLLKGMEYITDTTAPSTTASLDSGLYNYDLEIALAVNEADTDIYYTMDGSIPTTASPIYASPISITQTTTLKFFAKDPAGNMEAVQTKTYTIDKIAPATTALIESGTYYGSGLSLEFSTNESADIHYTTDGSTPTTASPIMTVGLNPPYNKYILIYQSGQGQSIHTIKFFAKDAAGNEEAVQTRVYTLINDTVLPVTTASIESGTYNYDLAVILTASETATIYYTIDGSMPTTLSPVYSSPIIITETCFLQFFAKDTAGNQETTQIKAYTIDKIAPAGTFANPSSRPFNSAVSREITIISSESAYIHYTTDGSTPTTASPSIFYNENNVPPGVIINIIPPATLKFFARDVAGNIEAEIHTEVYTLDTAAPATIASPAGGTYTTAQTITLTADEPATIYYSLDSSFPSLVYTAPITINASCILKFYAIDTAGNTAAYVQETYTINIAGAGWLAKANVPTPRVYHGSIEVNGKIYVIGGADAGWNVVGTNEVYDPALDTWTTLAPMPTPRVWGFGIAAVNNKIYVIGGEDVNWSTTGVVEEYDIASNTWAAKASLPDIRDGLTAAAINGKIYAIGGYRIGADNLTTNEEYDPLTDTWTAKTNMPTARDMLSSAVVNNKLYCIGGDSATEAKNEEYDPQTNTWLAKASLTTARTNFGAAAINGKIYCIGGYKAGIGVVSTNEEYDPLTDTWATKDNMTTAREGLSAASANGKIYCFGGDDSAGIVLNTNEEYTP